MLTNNKNIDAGKAFDWGHTSADYAKYRDRCITKKYVSFWCSMDRY